MKKESMEKWKKKKRKLEWWKVMMKYELNE